MITIGRVYIILWKAREPLFWPLIIIVFEIAILKFEMTIFMTHKRWLDKDSLQYGQSSNNHNCLWNWKRPQLPLNSEDPCSMQNRSCYPMSGPDSNTTRIWTTIREWYVVSYGSRMDARKTYVYLHTQNPTHHSRSHSLHDWGPGNLYDHPLNEHRNLHFFINKWDHHTRSKKDEANDDYRHD